MNSQVSRDAGPRYSAGKLKSTAPADARTGVTPPSGPSPDAAPRARAEPRTLACELRKLREPHDPRHKSRDRCFARVARPVADRNLPDARAAHRSRDARTHQWRSATPTPYDL